VALIFKASSVVGNASDRGSKNINMIRVFKEVIWAKYPSLVHCWGAIKE
jgi:hypothetical protein